jgi:hypothetical protein
MGMDAVSKVLIRKNHFRDLQPGPDRLPEPYPPQTVRASFQLLPDVLRHRIRRQAVQAWIHAVGVKTAYIEPDSPWENEYIESFNARVSACRSR